MQTKQQYFSQIDKIIRKFDQTLQNGDVSDSIVKNAQKILDKHADLFQFDESIGSQRYKLYELQALIHLSRGRIDDVDENLEEAQNLMSESENFVSKSIRNYTQQVRTKIRHPAKIGEKIPLELQFLTRGLKNSSILMAVITIITIWLIPWGLFYIYLSFKFKPKEIPDRKIVKLAALVTLPLCFAIVPIIVESEFWRMNKKLKEFEFKGNKAFKSDEVWLKVEKKLKRRNKIAWTILLTIIFIFAGLFIFALTTNKDSSISSTNSVSSPENLASQGAQAAKVDLNLPSKVDEVTTLTDITSESNTITYHYIIHDADTSNLTNFALENSVKPNVCSNLDLKKYLEKGVNFQYIYLVKETGSRYNFSISNNDC